ncbi:MAG TPA: hypothetical protein VG204_03455 [Terriglobia bacterium]|nr:hypothetical protein [Terriglobia bacterium]
MTRKFASLATIAVVAVIGLVFSRHRVSGQQSPQTQVYPDVWNEIAHDTSPPLKAIGKAQETGPNHTIRLLHPPHTPRQGQVDTAVQTSAGPLVSTTNGLNILGVGVGFSGPQGPFSPNAAPPDTNGAAGASQFVQWVNESYAVFGKSTGNVLLGPIAGNSLWSGFADTQCSAHNDGDIIAQYDKAANRWVMAQPVFESPYRYCIAVSTTSDATGTYNRYSFSMPNFPDYPKLSVWPDAYYGSFNLFQGNSFAGAYACAFDRSSMLSGAAARPAQCFTSPSEASFLPSDWDGAAAPPAGSPAFFVDLATFSSLNLYRFHVDFTTSSNSTFTGPFGIGVASYNEACGGGACIPQAGTSQQLDSLGDRLMYRLAYRNLGDHEALVASHSVEPSTVVGVRWYEIRSPGTTPTLFQQGTYSPDSNFRWMPSIAMDKAGDIALGYSVSSSAIHPTIAYTGRVPSDPLGAMETENTIITGGGSQTNGLTRWGDYSSMAVDPADDCTFWYTTEYEQTSGSFNWSTRIASFKFANCSTGPDFTIAATPSSQSVVQGNGTSYTVNVGALNGFAGSVTFSVSGLPTGANASFNPTSVTASGSSTLSVTTAATTPTGSYTLTVTGTSGALTHSATVQLVVTGPPDFTISASPGSQTVQVGSGTSYSVSVSALNGFSGSVGFSTSGLPTGANATFNPTSVTGSGSSTMSVTTSGSTPTGSYTVTVTGTSGGLTHSTTVTLVVSNSNFSISATPSSQTVTRGSHATYMVTVTGSGGFSGVVSFSVSGLPSRSSASFSPTSVTGSGTSTLTISTNKKQTPTGTFTLTITGTSGSLSHPTTVTLIVN